MEQWLEIVRNAINNCLKYCLVINIPAQTPNSMGIVASFASFELHIALSRVNDDMPPTFISKFSMVHACFEKQTL